jgi:hypothetical protein
VVCEDWLNFQNFASWYDENYYEIDGEKMQLDKDILIKGNKVYSSNTCVFTPKRINNLFTKRDFDRGKLPIGVCIDKQNSKKYMAQSNGIDGKRKTLGYFDKPLEAFNTYKVFKEKLIKQIAESYKGRIPNNLYESMIRYEVEITD